MKFPIGSKVKAWGRFYDLTDTLADPTTVYVTVMDPKHVKTTYTYGVGSDITKDGTGEYYVFISLTLPGRYYVRWYSTGTYQAANEDSFISVEARTR